MSDYIDSIPLIFEEINSAAFRLDFKILKAFFTF